MKEILRCALESGLSLVASLQARPGAHGANDLLFELQGAKRGRIKTLSDAEAMVILEMAKLNARHEELRRQASHDVAEDLNRQRVHWKP